MTACVFTGPTLPSDEVAATCAATVFPPAAMGDVIGAVKRGYTRVGIIDGYFDGEPSVWHKEVLWAIDQGATVYGAASIGALRAAELYPYGMIGVGEIFADYAEGRLEDDDEVALVHGPRELGYPPLSEPMVNIRPTLAMAVEAGLIEHDAAEELKEAAKRSHFSERTWARIVDHASRLLRDPLAAERLSAWLPLNRVDRKKRDAVELLAVMSEGVKDEAPRFRFEWTVMWDKALAWQRAAEGDEGRSRVLDELRLSPGRFAEVRRRALARYLASAHRTGPALNGASRDLSAVLDRFRRDHGLLSRDRLDGWLAENGLDDDGLARLLDTDAAIEAAEFAAGPALETAMIDELKRAGRFASLSARAAAKRETLEGRGPATHEALPGSALLLERFAQASDIPVDANDPDAIMRALALRDRATLFKLIADEILFEDFGRIDGSGCYKGSSET